MGVSMSAIEDKSNLLAYWIPRITDMVQSRNNLSRADLEYVAIQLDKLKDQRLKDCITTILGWGDAERQDLETFIALSFEVIKKSSPSALRNAAKTVELRY